MGKKRKSRDDINLTPKELLKPINIELFGSDNDPCFGKLYDLGTPECKRCGDSEICATVVSQKLNVKRKTIETENRFKDIELDRIKYIKKKLGKIPKIRIKKMTAKKFNISKKEVSKLLKIILKDDK